MSFPYGEPVKCRPLGYAETGVRLGADRISHLLMSMSSNINSQTGALGPRQNTQLQSNPRRHQRQFTIPADIQDRPAILDPNSDGVPQYSSIFPASITTYIFDKIGEEEEASVEVFHQYYKKCSINASLDQKRRIVTVWSEPRHYTGTLTEEVKM